MLEWNTYLGDINKRTIIVFNVFKHYSFYEDLKKIIKKYKTIEDFSTELNRICMYYFWSKCEYEIILTCWPTWDKFKEEKIDVYSQLKLNWDKFVNYIWDNKKEILKNEK